jgi:hypothetical protein
VTAFPLLQVWTSDLGKEVLKGVGPARRRDSDAAPELKERLPVKNSGDPVDGKPRGLNQSDYDIDGGDPEIDQALAGLDTDVTLGPWACEFPRMSG